MFEHACRLGLEGIVSKRVDLPYRAGRGDHWLKVKAVLRQEFIILGYIPSTVAKGAGRRPADRILRRRHAALRRAGRHRLFQRAGARAARRARRDRRAQAEAGQRSARRRREGRALGEAAARLRGRVPRLDRGQADPPSLVQGAARGSPGRGDRAGDSRRTGRKSDRRARAHPRAPHPSRAHPLAGAGRHQGGPGRILRRHRRLDPAAPRRDAC